jgi:glycosyltransferase involved in cell wall biosynthesis
VTSASENPIRVLHVIPGVDSRAGGPQVAMRGLCKAQKAAGLEVTALATFRKGDRHDIAEDLEEAGVHVTLVGPAHGPLHSHRHLPATLRALVQSVDVVHAHGVWEDVQHHAARIAHRFAKPYVMTPHGMLSPWSLGQKPLKKRIYMALRLRKDLNRAALVHVTSTTERDLLAPLKLTAPIRVEPLGVELAEFQELPKQGAFRAKFPQVADRKIVMFLGRLHPRKGMEYLIPALRRAGLKDVALVAVGPDSDNFRASLERTAADEGVADQVLFTGMLRGRDRLEALTDADLFALPSEHENFGLVVVEALACGTPVLVSDGVALHREISEAGVGMTTKVGDVDALATELRRWLAGADGDALRRAASDRARAFVWERFDWQKIAARWADHYRGLVSRAGGGA